MINRLKKLIRLARISNGGADDKQQPLQQIDYLGKVGNSVIFFPYGMHGNIPIDTLILMLTPNGDSASRVGIAVAPENRPKMAVNEFCLYHPKTESIIHFKNDGSIDVTAPEMVLNGNVTINGDLDVTGATALGDTVTSNGKDISDTHVHSGVTSGGSNTGAPV